MEQEQKNGILLIDKPAGFTSHDVVAKLRGICRTRRIGHGGTLDPMATGVLPVFLGGATRAADFAAAREKEYIAGFALGFATDTQDTTGTVLQRSDRRVAAADVLQGVQAMQGVQQQVPPMYSAVQIDGKRLYDLARKGVEVERPAREITVLEAELLAFDEEMQTGKVRVVCSKGTYVRTLVHDLGQRLGTLAAMNALTRTRSGQFVLSDCLSLTQVQQAADDGRLGELLRPVDTLFTAYPALTLTEEGANRAANGAIVFARQCSGFDETPGEIYRVYSGEQFLMLGQVRALDKGGCGLFVYKKFA